MIGGVTAASGSLPWGRARRAAARAALPRPGLAVSLEEATGLVLAAPLLARTPLPPYDVATTDGFAVSGPGPWTVDTGASGRLHDGAAVRVAADTSLPPGTDAVLPEAHAVVRTGKDVTWLYVGDAHTGRQAQRPGHIPPGSFVTTGGAECAAGGIVAPAGTVVTPALVAVAAASGNDTLEVTRPPDVAPVLLGDTRLAKGPARGGRTREAVTPLLPGAIARAGARCLPLQQVPGTVGTLHAQACKVVDDVAADLVLLTGEPGAAAQREAASVLSSLGATPLVADVAVHPGAEGILAELPDGRLAAYLPGDPAGAVAALVTLVLPLLRAMSGRAEPAPTLALLDEAAEGDPDVTTLVPAVHHRGELADTAAPAVGGPLLGLATSHSLAVVPPGGAPAGQLVELVEMP